MSKSSIAARNAEICRMLVDNRRTAVEVARVYNMSAKSIQRIAAAGGVKLTVHIERAQQRRAQIVELHEAGLVAADIARAMGITESAVVVGLKLAGVGGIDPGALCACGKPAAVQRSQPECVNCYQARRRREEPEYLEHHREINRRSAARRRARAKLATAERAEAGVTSPLVDHAD